MAWRNPDFQLKTQTLTGSSPLPAQREAALVRLSSGTAKATARGPSLQGEAGRCPQGATRAPFRDSAC